MPTAIRFTIYGARMDCGEINYKYCGGATDLADALAKYESAREYPIHSLQMIIDGRRTVTIFGELSDEERRVADALASIQSTFSTCCSDDILSCPPEPDEQLYAVRKAYRTLASKFKEEQMKVKNLTALLAAAHLKLSAIKTAVANV